MNKKEDTEKDHKHDKRHKEVHDSAGIDFSEEPTQGKALVDLFHRDGKPLEFPDLQKNQVCGDGGIEEISQRGRNGAEAAITSHEKIDQQRKSNDAEAGYQHEPTESGRVKDLPKEGFVSVNSCFY